MVDSSKLEGTEFKALIDLSDIIVEGTIVKLVEISGNTVAHVSTVGEAAIKARMQLTTLLDEEKFEQQQSPFYTEVFVGEQFKLKNNFSYMSTDGTRRSMFGSGCIWTVVQTNVDETDLCELRDYTDDDTGAYSARHYVSPRVMPRSEFEYVSRRKVDYEKVVPSIDQQNITPQHIHVEKRVAELMTAIHRVNLANDSLVPVEWIEEAHELMEWHKRWWEKLQRTASDKVEQGDD